MKVREPVARPLDVVAVELLLSASQAFLVGVLMYLAIGIWDERGVGFGPVALILALLGLTIGGAWVYWLLGGVGWPMAAANVPTAMFLGFVLILSWQGGNFLKLDGVPTVLALAASIYGIVGGVFIDPPRRWRWDQRQKLRAGTEVPRVTETTRAAVAMVPRSLPRRGTVAAESATDTDSRTSTPASAASATAVAVEDRPSSDTSIPYLSTDSDELKEASESVIDEKPESLETDELAGDARTTPGDTSTVLDGPVEESASSTDEPADDDDADGSIELPTSVEPRAQRSPWAWAAPPEWTRDDEDDSAPGASSRS